MKNRGFYLYKIILVLALLLPGQAVLAAPQTQNKPSTPTSATGWLTVIWGDDATDTHHSTTVFWLTDTDGHTTSLSVDEARLNPDLLSALNQQYVTVEGQINASQPALVVTAVRAAPRQPARAAQLTLNGPQPWLSILCKFPDVAAEPQPRSFFQGMYSSSYPGLDHYWREVSYNNVNLTGSQAVGWYTLPHPRSYYVYDRNNDGRAELDHSRAVNDCTAAADPEIDFPTYVGLNLMFNTELDGYAWGGAYYMTLDGVTKPYRVTWEPPWAYANLSVIAHEMGHGFGLPHSSGSYGATYDNRWDVMSDAWSCCGCNNDPTYSCLGQHTIAYHKYLLGWIPEERNTTVAIGSRATITLEQMTRWPTNTNPLMVTIPVSPTLFYVVEARAQEGYDLKLPGTTVIIHEINTTRYTPAYIVDVDNNQNTGDAGAMWDPGETFTDQSNRITVAVEAATATGFVITIQNQGAPMPSDLTIGGIDEGHVNTPYDFTAVVNPALQPHEVTHIWEASGHDPITITGELTSTVTFVWETPGPQVITVTAVTDKGMTQNSHTVNVKREFQLYLPLTLRNAGRPGL